MVDRVHEYSIADKCEQVILGYTRYMNISRVMRALAIMSGASVLLFVVRIMSYRSLNYWYLSWNLALAVLPLCLAIFIANQLRTRRWLSMPMFLLTAAYAGFLPNSFYIATDLIHVQYASSQTILFDVVMILSYTLAGLLAGFTSVYLLHRELIKRIASDSAHLIIGALLLACSFAIYLGRFLRWNTWDVLTNPGGIIFDVSYRLVNPLGGRQMVSTTILFFVLLGSLYWAIWQGLHPKSTQKAKKHA